MWDNTYASMRCKQHREKRVAWYILTDIESVQEHCLINEFEGHKTVISNRVGYEEITRMHKSYIRWRNLLSGHEKHICIIAAERH